MFGFNSKDMVEPDAMPGNTSFVAGFVQANVGDTSPNTYVLFLCLIISISSDSFASPSSLGAFCESPGEPWDGLPCEAEHSTCGNKTEDCHGRCVLFT